MHFLIDTFGPEGWGPLLLRATLMTLAVSICAFAVGIVFGAMGAAAKLSRSTVARATAEAYTTILRGLPDLLVVYLFYFGSSQVVATVASFFGWTGFFDLPTFLVGVLAVAVISGAFQTEVLRAAYTAIPKGQLDAARVTGMSEWLIIRRISAPQLLRTALPGMGNVWRGVMKESALISVIGLVELMRQVNLAASATQQPLLLFGAGIVLYLLLTYITSYVFIALERASARGIAADLGQA